MSGIAAEVHRITGHLETLGIPFAIVGGLAVSARTEPRFTRDVDIAVAVSDDREAEQLVTALRSHGYRPVFLTEQQVAARLATARLVRGSGDAEGILDLLFASSGIEAEVAASAERIELFEGVRAPVATVGALIALKLLARDDRERPQDVADLRALVRGATSAELGEADRLCGRIEERGFQRGRRLRDDLAALLDVPA
ncbi:MAG: nucleotidyl transferase AbiEii/AbiGii toxin family protein [Chloroflexota bacterium]